jgi:transcriptional regulator with XRE-family HTH domain
MTCVVSAGTNRVVSDDISERLQWILDHRDISARELARLAELPSESHVGLILTRGGTRTSGKALAKIARAARVELEWLIEGTGPRDVGTHVEYTDRYPNRARAIEALRDEVLPESIADLRIVTLQSDTDPLVSEWIDDLRALDRRRRRGLPAEGAERAAADTARLVEETRPAFDEEIAAGKADVKRKTIQYSVPAQPTALVAEPRGSQYGKPTKKRRR